MNIKFLDPVQGCPKSSEIMGDRLSLGRFILLFCDKTLAISYLIVLNFFPINSKSDLFFYSVGKTNSM